MLDANEFLGTVLDSLPLGVVLKDPSNDYRYIFANKTAEDLWSFKKEQLIGKTDFEVQGEETAYYFRESDIRCFTTGESVYLDHIPVENDKIKNRWIRVWKTCFNAPDGRRIILGVGQDVTELVEAQQSRSRTENLLAHERQKLAHASRLAGLGEMAGGIAHEINTPLGVISLHCDVAMTLLEQGPPQSALVQHLQKIQDTTFRIASIVQTMRSLSKGQIEDRSEWVSLKAVLEDLRLLIGHRLKQDDVDLRIDGFDGRLQLYCQSVQLSQVFLNLISNSIDAIRGEAKWIRVSCHEIDPEWLEIRFTDSGVPIPGDIQERMFETFYTTKALHKGTGLGLSISREIIRGYEGELCYDSQAATTTFVIRWPKDRYQFAATV